MDYNPVIHKTYYKSYYTSTLVGKLILVSDGINIIGLWFENQKPLIDNKECILIEKDLLVFELTKNWLDRYFKGEKPKIEEIPIKFIGSKFRKKVWNLLIKIPYGQIITYGDLAKLVYGSGKYNSRIIGTTVGSNPISIIVPCHRVIGSKNKLTGYGGGMLNKIRLLKLEKVNVSNMQYN